MWLGLDFGTTNSAIAFYDGKQSHSLLVDPTNTDPYIMPSMIYIDRDGHATVGAQAAQVYLQSETGRRVRWQIRDAAEVEITVASFENDPIEFIQTVNVLVDVAANGRLMQSIKTALFNERYEGTQIFGQFYRIDSLIAIVLKALREVAERHFQQPCKQVVMGRPVRFSHNPLADSRAEAILLKAAHLAGFEDIVFQLEPVGIAYLYHRENNQRQTALVFDFGGGTLDLTIARVGGEEPPQIVATEGVLVGGNDLDRRIMESLLPYFGAGDDTQLPPQMLDKLLSWQTMPILSQPHHVERIRELQQSADDPQPYLALETLVSNNLGFKLFQEIEEAKIRLSTQASTMLRFEYDHIHINQIITRKRFKRLIRDEIQQISAGIDVLLAKASADAAEIDVVLRTGGSSQVPAFYDLLVERFGKEKQRAIDPLVSVVGGFAIAAYERGDQILKPQFIHAKIGGKVYLDRNFVIDRIPSDLNQLPLIRTMQSDAESQADLVVCFDIDRPARVYVAYESDVQQLPLWLRGFEREPMQIEIKDDFALISKVMQVYSKTYQPGEVVLGGNQAAGYDGSAVLNYFVLLNDLS